MGGSRRTTDASDQDYTAARAEGEPYLVVDKKIAVPLYIVVLLFVWLVPATVTVVKFLHRFDRIDAELHARAKGTEWNREQARQQWENFKSVNPTLSVPDTRAVGFVSKSGEWTYPDN